MVFKLFVVGALVFVLNNQNEARPSQNFLDYSDAISADPQVISDVIGHGNISEGDLLTTTRAQVIDSEYVTTSLRLESSAETEGKSDAPELNRKASRNLVQVTNSCHFFMFMSGTVGIGSLTIFGLVGNALSFFALFKQRATSSSILILLTLATSDTIVIIMMFILKSVPAFVTYSGLLTGFQYYYPYCFVYGFPIATTASVMTSFTTLLIAIHRFIAVCKPFKLTAIASTRQTKYHIAGVFLFVIIFNIPMFFQSELYTVKSNETNVTTTLWRYTTLRTNVYFSLIYSVIMYYLVILICPFIILLTITIKLIRELRRARRARSEMCTSVATGSQQTDELTAALVGIVTVYFICQTLIFMRRLLQRFFFNDRGCGSLDMYAGEFAALLVVLNSSTNFLVYIIVSKSFRETLYGTFNFTIQKKFRTQQRIRVDKDTEERFYN